MPTPIYDSRDIRCKAPFGAVAAGTPVTLWVHLPKWLQADEVLLTVYLIDRWNRPTFCPMEFVASGPTQNTYRCTYTPGKPAVRVYHFEARCGDVVHTIRRGGDGTGVVGDGGDWQLTVYDPAMETPACLGEGVMYQIFPDRFFASGQPKENVPPDRTLRTDWDGIPQWRPNEQGEVTNSDYFCGDLEGIRQKLDYLESLGVTCLYFNPVFEAHSNHRYNTADYHTIDPLLGTNEDFQRLCAEAAQRGISVILDGVFSHTGSDSIYFNKEGRYGSGGAYNDQNSPFYPWYRFSRYPDEYECWWGFNTLPNVEEQEPSYLEFICGEEGVLRHWMRLGASGFRLDVADELPDEFLDRLHRCVKEENPRAAVIGEVWEDASNKVSYGVRRRYLLGEQLDSVMNYPFKDALLNYLRYGGGGAFYNTVMQILENYPPPVIPALMNSLSTHDTPRAITVLGGEPMGDNGRDWQETRHQLSPEEYQRGKQLFLLGSILQFGLPGTPCVYYGDEAGLCGYKDPFNRTCYPWGSEDTELLEDIRTLGSIRREHPVFAKAEFLPLLFGDEVCAFVRRSAGLSLLFAVNRGERRHRLLLPKEIAPEVLFLTGEYRDNALGAYSGVVLRWHDNPQG